MRHWSQLATRNWRAKPSRTVGVLLAIALGTAAVVWVTACFESVRRTVLQWAEQYVGNAHIMVESPIGKYDTIPASMVGQLAALPNVKDITTRLVQRLPGKAFKKGQDAASNPDAFKPDYDKQIDLHGIDIDNELRLRHYPLVDNGGRMLRKDDHFKCLLEQAYADENNIGVGDYVNVWGKHPQPIAFEVIGLVTRRRIAKFQKGWIVTQMADAQEVAGEPGMTTSIDIVLKDASPPALRRATELIRNEARRVVKNISVRSVEARMRQIVAAQRQQELVLVLLSCVAMMTAMFIILSTLSMGAVERVRQMGLMRCIGLTGGQLAAMAMAEVLPLGLLGIAVGVPVGLTLTWITTLLVPEYVGAFPISWSELGTAANEDVGALFEQLHVALARTGIYRAAIAGMGVTIFGAMLPMLRAWFASPLEASRPRAEGQRPIWIVVCASLGVLLLGVQWVMVNGAPESLQPTLAPVFDLIGKALGAYVGVGGLRRSPDFATVASAGIVLLYIGYALISPLLVWLISRGAVRVAAALLGVRERLLQDQVGKAVWRSTGIACGLMVGLSLIVGLVVFSETVRSGWSFPEQFPEAYVWGLKDLRPDAREVVQDVPGIQELMVGHAANCWVNEKPTFMEKVFISNTWFLGVEPDPCLDMLKLEFVEGDEATARKLMKQGGYIIVAEDFSRTRNAHLGDPVTVGIGTTTHVFKVCGVMQSPALDIAAGYFQAMSEANVVANGSVMGTRADLERIYGEKNTRLMLLNFNLSDPGLARLKHPLYALDRAEPPVDFPPPPNSAAARGIPAECYNPQTPLLRRWQRFLEECVLREIVGRLQEPLAFYGTARELKDNIDRELTHVTRLLAAVPSIALLVAAIGVANLMTASVTSRARQLAILRAVGATKNLVLRMVLGEALVLGFIGTLLGLALGLHVAYDVTTMTEQMWGFKATLTLPWDTLSIAVAVTVGLCAAAGIVPARYASRTNIVDALHVA